MKVKQKQSRQCGSRRSRREQGRAVFRRLYLETLENRQLLAVDAVLSLERATIIGSVANIPVTIDYSATANETLSYFSLDASQSSASLIGPGSDFSAFFFTPSSPLLDDWTQIGFFNAPGFESSVEFDDSLIAPLSTGIYTLGILSVDFGAAGLSFGDIFDVSLDGIDTVIGVTDQTGFHFEPVSFNPGTRTVVPVSLSGPSSVNEGAVYTLTIDTLVQSGIDLIIDWGDGQQETLDVEVLPADRRLTHVYADGVRASTILVDVRDQHGTRAFAGNLDVAIHNVEPTTVLSGNATANEGLPYSLTIGDVQDPGDDTVTHYHIHWGDQQQETIAAADLPANRTVTHTYLDGMALAFIVVDITDEDGTHEEAGSLHITVNNVAPTVALSGATDVNEGSVYTLTIGAVADTGVDSVSQFVIHWGDEFDQTINVADLPVDGRIDHPYADGDAAFLITVDLVDDDDGAHPTAGALAVRVNNVAPTVTLSGDSAIDEGLPYTLTIGTVSDPGQDTVIRYVVYWGDGQQDSIIAANLPLDRHVTHTYADNISPPTIVVDVVDEDGTHQAGSKTVTINNVEPIITLSGATTINEGELYTLTLGPVSDAGTDTVVGYVIHWGDGQSDSINAEDLLANRQRTHTYADGPSSALIVVDVLDEDGIHAEASSLPVSVRNVAPTIALSGAANVTEGSTYTLTLGAISDPGTDTVSQYIIRWSDGQVQTIDVVDVPADRQIAHEYMDGPRTGLIAVDLVDEDDTHIAAGLLAVTVNNVPPTIAVTGATSTAEGSVYTLTLGAVTDPGSDTVTQYVIRWGDGQPTTINAADLPANRQVTHTFPDGPSSSSVVVDLVDEDGTHTAAGSKTVTVSNVSPTITLTGAPTVAEGSPYVLTLGPVIDPGADTVSQYIIRWGDGRQDVIGGASLPANRQVAHSYVDNFSPTITVDLIDEDGTFTSTGSLPITVTNVSPTVTTITNTSSGCGGVLEGNPISVSLSFSDPGADSSPGGTSENFTATIDWGDGTQQPPSQISITKIPGGPGVPTVGTVSASHTYTNGGIYRITVKVFDDDGQFASASSTTMITGSGVNKNVLQVVGTNNSDLVTIDKQGNGQFKVHADFYASGNFKTFSTTGVYLINVVLCGADDHLNIAGDIETTQILDGGPGIDHINAHQNALVVNEGELPTGLTVDLGVVDFRTVPNLNLATADRSFSFNAMYPGTLTLDAAFTASQGSGQLVLLDQNLNVLSSSVPVTGGQRIDGQSVAGEKFYVFVLGSNPDVNLTIVNMITQNSPLTVHGTSGDDKFEFVAGDIIQVRVNGIDYNYDPARVSSVTFVGNGGSDSIVLTASSADDVKSLLEQTAELLGDNYAVFVRGIDSIEVRDGDHQSLLQNQALVTDVNGDGVMTPLDVLVVINWLNDHGSEKVVDILTSTPPGTVTFKYDVSGDGIISSIDALLIINAILKATEDANGGAEGEARESPHGQLDSPDIVLNLGPESHCSDLNPLAAAAPPRRDIVDQLLEDIGTWQTEVELPPQLLATIAESRHRETDDDIYGPLLMLDAPSSSDPLDFP